MSKICGIELKSSEATVAVIGNENGAVGFIDLEPRKIKIGDHENTDSVRSFFSTFCNFIRDNHIDTIVIKQRALKGKFAGGPVSFKLEALIQLNEIAAVEFVSGQAIAASNKREAIDVPDYIKKYQAQAFMAAICYLRKVS